MKLAAVALLLFALPAQAQMYKCVDAHGKVDYRDRGGDGCNAVDIRPSPPISGQPAAARPENFAVQDAELRRRQLERDAAQERERQLLAQRCAPLRDEQRFLSSGLRIWSLNAKGERVFMEDAERERRLAELAQELRSCP